MPRYSITTDTLLMCARCETMKPDEAFGFHARNKGRRGRMSSCRKCANQYAREWRQANPDKVRYIKRKADLKGQYGLSVQEYADMLVAQGGGCAICGRGPSASNKNVLAVDHCHESGQVRGLLCHPCNLALGALKDDVGLMRRMIGYVENAKA